jgi:hypothetical protein
VKGGTVILKTFTMAFLAINSPLDAGGLSITNVPEMIGGHALLVGLTEILQLTVCFRFPV